MRRPIVAAGRATACREAEPGGQIGVVRSSGLKSGGCWPSIVARRRPLPSTRLTARPDQQQYVQQQYGQLPLSFETRSFEANHGESDSQVKFLARGAGYSLFLTDSGAVFDVRRSAARTTATCHSIAWETRMQTQPALA